MGPLAEAVAVVALITEETGFVSGGEVDAVADAVFGEADEGGGGVVGFGDIGEADVFHEADVGVDMDDVVFGAEFGVH